MEASREHLEKTIIKTYLVQRLLEIRIGHVVIIFRINTELFDSFLKKKNYRVLVQIHRVD